ncbi:MAG TPA: hypothetical protein VGV61_06890, partial [Thermoanaerobaculia bacterium]|nr:hypothetical protein [Thermoanaerobaculia bacterium]
KQGVVADVVRLWRADLLLRQYRLNEASSLLAAFPNPSSYPLAELLRARLAVVRGAGDEALNHYERVRESGADEDGLRFEAAVALATTGQDEAADRAFSRLTSSGSRLATPYYAAAEHALADDRGDEGEAFFRAAWRLQPISRELLFRDPLLASLCTRQGLFPLFQFGSMEEPRAGEAVPGAEALALPAAVTATLTGNLLRLVVGDAEVRVPGGGRLAPPGAVVDSPAAFARRERDEAIAQLPALRDQTTSAGALAQPALQRRLELAAEGLAEQERWGDLLSLTAPLSSYAGRLPPELTQLRAAALIHDDKPRDAFELLVRLAQDDKLHGRRDTGTLYQLADALRREQRYELAVKVLHRANQISGLSAGAARERQVRMEQRLAEAHQQLATRYFHIRFPKVTGAQYAQQLAVVLEEERQRLARWIPLRDPKPIEVDLYPVEEFLSSYSQEMPVVGIFDGRVRVPFADLRSLHPQLVAILSHELAHALITQATGDHAPKWVQEGLAQHVEMVQQVANPFPDLAKAGHELSLVVVEQALGGFSEPQFVEVSYAEAAWAFHYLEAAHGVEGIHRLLAGYGQGKGEAAALQAAIGMDAAGLDDALRAWARERAPQSWPSKLRRYDEEAERLLLTRPNESAPAKLAASSDRFHGGAQLPAAMAAWHAQYLQWAKPVKAAYGPVLAYVHGETRGADPTGACRRLSDAATAALASPQRFEAPDRRLTRPLLLAFTSLRDLGLACGRAEDAVARAQSAKTQQLLGEAAAVLAVYGLRP